MKRVIDAARYGRPFPFRAGPTARVLGCTTLAPGVAACFRAGAS